MTYPTPTPAELKTRLPVFTPVDDGIVQTAINEAARRVGTGWDDQDGPLGIIYLAAHYLTLDGHGPGAKVAAQRAAGVRSFKSASLQVDFQDMRQDEAFYALTSYGVRYYQLLQVNAGGPLVVNGADHRGSHLAQDIGVRGYYAGRTWR